MERYIVLFSFLRKTRGIFSRVKGAARSHAAEAAHPAGDQPPAAATATEPCKPARGRSD